MNDPRWEQLIHSYLDGLLSIAERDELEALLLDSSAARHRFWEIAEIHGLTDEAVRIAWRESQNISEASIQSRTTKRSFTPSTVSSNSARFAAMAACLAMVVFGLWWAKNQMAKMALNNEQRASGFAVLGQQADARWSDQRDLVDGDLIADELLELDAGLARIDFFSGASLVLEGPAKLQILSSMKVRIDSGKIRARIPTAARGFRVLTRQGDVVDLGTEFAIQVDTNGSELHVIEGEVDWFPIQDTKRHLVDGQALQCDIHGIMADLPSNAGHFVSAMELEQRSVSGLARKRARWKAYLEQLRSDDRLVMLHTLDRQSETTVSHLSLDLATKAGHVAADGAVVAARYDFDRWGDKQGAMDFRPSGSRIRVEAPKTLQNMSLFAWVKINSLDRRFNSLFLTDGFDAREPHWQFHNDGRLLLVVCGATDHGPDKQSYFTPSIWSQTQSGQWMMLATTYDSENGKVSHYFNGKLVSEQEIPVELRGIPLSIGPASIGNWNLSYRSDPSFAIRNLNGSIDDFAMFAEALSVKEIAEIYETGKP